MAAHSYNLGTQDMEAGSLGVQGYPWLHSEFKDGLGYRRFCLKESMTCHYEGKLDSKRESCWAAGIPSAWPPQTVMPWLTFSTTMGSIPPNCESE